MYQCFGKYFDGKTSQPQKAEVSFDSGFDELIFRNGGLKIVWPLREVRYENCGNFLEMRRAKDSDEFLAVDDEEFKKHFFHYLRKNDKISVYQKLIHLNFPKHIALGAVILAVIVLGYFFAVPYIAEKSVALIPEIFDEKLGDSFIGEFSLSNKLDTAKTLLLNEFAEELNLNNHRGLHFKVIQSTTANAFALPNGEIVVYTGILEKMDDYAELAGLIAHEAAHINNRHSMKMLCRNLAGYIFVSALFADVNGIIAVLAENAHSLNTLSYSRTFETEADEQAVYLMMQNGIDPQGFVSLFKIIGEDSDDSISQFWEFAQTHPLTSRRIEKIQQIISENTFSSCNNSKLELLFEEMWKEGREAE